MDVLSDAISAMRTGRTHSARVERRAPFHRAFPATEGAGFHIVLAGTCWLIPADGDPFPLGPGDVVFLPYGAGCAVADSLGTPPGTAPGTGRPVVLLCGAYLMDQSRPHPLLSELPPLVHLPARVGRHQSMRAAIEMLATELEQPGPGSDAMLPALLDALLLHMLRAWLAEQTSQHPAVGWAAALADPGVTRALHGIHDEPARAWTVQELGALAAMSRATFARRFGALVGQPPLTYLRWWRMTVAARLLRSTDAPLDTVAKQVGYSSEFAFSTAFKREYGVAAGRYRSQGGG